MPDRPAHVIRGDKAKRVLWQGLRHRRAGGGRVDHRAVHLLRPAERQIEAARFHALRRHREPDTFHRHIAQERAEVEADFGQEAVERRAAQVAADEGAGRQPARDFLKAGGL
ncbi:MAG: hypothetical protein M5R40_28055 [Anaerolineae bacterium]|nr:hypothetical protein [Anaerolineae bacterium]